MNAGNEEFGRIYFYEFGECTIFCMILTNTPCILMGTFNPISKKMALHHGRNMTYGNRHLTHPVRLFRSIEKNCRGTWRPMGDFDSLGPTHHAGTNRQPFGLQDQDIESRTQLRGFS